MIQFFHDEEWKEFHFERKSNIHYAISNYGRLVSFTDSIEKGRLLKGGKVEGYLLFQYKIRKGKTIIFRRILYHKLVAMQFIPKKTEDEKFVLHLDYNKLNNHFTNLKWANQVELTKHINNSPRVIELKQKQKENPMTRIGKKLTSTQVMLIKKKLLNPNRRTRLKIIARQFGVTEMTLHRIRTGENWGHIKV